MKNDLVKAVCEFEHQPKLAQKLLTLSPKELAKTLISGLIGKNNTALFAPISNYIFCRDIGVIVNKHLLITQAMKRARCRETLLSWFIYHHSTQFAELQKENRIIELSANVEELLENIGGTVNELSIEGGDVMTFGENNLLIGVSERTSRFAFEKIKEKLFANDVIEFVTMVEIPRERFCMHLDTIFTRIDEDVCVVFAPLILEENKLKIKKYQKGVEKPQVFASLKDWFYAINPNFKFVLSGGGKSPFAEREQWTDGCNLFAIKPGVVVTYDRNKMTSKAIEKMGYKAIKAEALIEKFKKNILNPTDLQKSLILIPSNELSRARGGTHCLTFPLLRE